MPNSCIVKFCENVGNHRFPKDEKLKADWIKAINHIKPRISRRIHTFICSAHFKPTDFAASPTHLLRDNTRKVLKKGVLPSIFPWTRVSQQEALQQSYKSPSPSLIFDGSKVSATYSCTPPLAFVEMPPILVSDIEVDSIVDPLQHSSYISEIEVPTVEDAQTLDNLPPMSDIVNDDDITDVIEIGTQSVQTATEQPQNEKSSMQTQTHGHCLTSGFSIHDYKHDDKCLHFYTGLENFEKIMLVFYSLGKCANSLSYFYGPPPERIDALEQFFITLIILRRHKTFEEISMLFKLTIKHVYSIFITWVRFMALQWRNLDLWADKETVRAYTPLDFNDKYPATRVVLDATECPIKKPTLPLAQQITFSSYKNRNTMKVMIGITPGGLISYVSRAYGGSVTDRQIIERSSILDRFDYNDEMMVDKGINVQDIMVSYGVKVNMPAFFKKGAQIGPETLLSNRKVASKRVHVERVIGMMKTYKILTQPMNQTEVILSSDIVFIIAMLVNFRTNIINKNA